MSHFNQLTPAEAERLALFAEECGEALHIVGKILRHGYGSKDPTDPEALDNRQLLTEELGDIEVAMIRFCRAGDIQRSHMHARASYKLHHQKWLHHQPAVKCDGNHGGPKCSDPECWNQ